MKGERPSTTARIVALGVSCVASDPRLHAVAAPLQPDIARRWVAETSFGWRLVAKASTTALGRKIARGLERWFVPGIMLHYVVRKRFIDDVVTEALGDGFTQVIVLGAGFDTLAARLHRSASEIRFIEIDHPVTQAVKRRGMREGGGLLANVFLLAADLSRQSLTSLLRVPTLREGEPTIVVAEGFLMYLSVEEVLRLFDELASLPTSRLRLVFTTMIEQRSGLPGFQDEGWLLERFS